MWFRFTFELHSLYLRHARLVLRAMHISCDEIAESGDPARHSARSIRDSPFSCKTWPSLDSYHSSQSAKLGSFHLQHQLDTTFLLGFKSPVIDSQLLSPAQLCSMPPLSASPMMPLTRADSSRNPEQPKPIVQVQQQSIHFLDTIASARALLANPVIMTK